MKHLIRCWILLFFLPVFGLINYLDCYKNVQKLRHQTKMKINLAVKVSMQKEKEKREKKKGTAFREGRLRGREQKIKKISRF